MYMSDPGRNYQVCQYVEPLLKIQYTLKKTWMHSTNKKITKKSMVLLYSPEVKWHSFIKNTGYISMIFNWSHSFSRICFYLFQVVYVTATLPYVMLIVFFIRGLTLDGASNGISYYVTPVWDKLLKPAVSRNFIFRQKVVAKYSSPA